MKANIKRFDSREEMKGLVARSRLTDMGVDIVASGYETCCPSCEELCEIIAVPRYEEAVQCPSCEQLFVVGLPEHAYN